MTQGPLPSAPTPRKSREQRDAEQRALRVVQRRVAAIGFFAITVHGVFGCIGLGLVLDNQGRHSDAIAITVMSGVIAAITYAGVRVILQRSLWSPVWIAVAALPTIAALVWLLR
ncbi:hypothetical protein KV102_10000 [Mumia sp. zg.B53]|uniref:hypothetical protein n=1 Tax=unclassified Mumia TaxID=2621872 RepID=UPI001C6DF0BD|nr:MULTISPECIES: hypothetical protein [unclassified Mumia]MBW9210558.1 hypothetical protein [Mumia sp. zg.B21]MBW9215171.1 hypothetical protein [Mumia sp. zg.B53]MDD9347605.1 hypothetical protein [Mumia sp.]